MNRKTLKELCRKKYGFLPPDYLSKENEFMDLPNCCKQSLTVEDFKKAAKALQAANVAQPYFALAPLPTAVPHPVPTDWFGGWDNVKQEGKTPMCAYNDAYANASITATKSDIAVTREYFLDRLQSALHPKDEELVKLFNLHVDNTPKNYKETIDAIKGGKYTIDPKIEKRLEAADDDEPLYWGTTFGIIWDGPQPDRDGYNTARQEAKKQLTAARDIIMSGDNAAMKAAVEAFEAWTPTPATTSN